MLFVYFQPIVKVAGVGWGMTAPNNSGLSDEQHRLALSDTPPLKPKSTTALRIWAFAFKAVLRRFFNRIRNALARMQVASAEAAEAQARLAQEQVKFEYEVAQLKATRVHIRHEKAQLESAHLQTFRASLLLIFFVATFAGVGWVIFREMNRSAILVEGFGIPPELAEQGYTPTVVASRVRDQMRKTLDAAALSGVQTESKEDRLDATVPVAGMSLQTIVAYLRQALGVPVERVAGDITFVTKPPPTVTGKDKDPCLESAGARFIRLVIRYSDSKKVRTDVVTCAEGEVESLIERGGEKAAYLTDPLMYAQYIFQSETDAKSERFTGTARAVETAITQSQGLAKVVAYSLKAQMLAQQKRFDEAIVSLGEADAIPMPPWNKGALRVQRGDLEASRGNKNSAAEQYEQALSDNISVDLTVEVGEKLWELDRKKEAIEALRLANASPSMTFGLRIRLGDALVKAALWNEAADAYERAYDSSATYEELRQWGRKLYVVGRGDEAERRLRQRYGGKTADSNNSADQTSAQNHLILGDLLGFSLERWEAALDEYRSAIPADEVGARRGEAAALYNLGRYSEALAAAQRAVELHPNDAFALGRGASSLLRIGQLSEALVQFDRAERISPEDDWNAEGKLETLEKLHRYADAERFAARRVSASGDWLLKSGRELHYLGRYSEAIDKYRRLVQVSPPSEFDLLFVRNDWAKSLISLEQFDSAIATLQDGGICLLCSFQLGRAYFHANRLNEATETFKQEIRSWGPRSVIWLAVANPGAPQDLRALAPEIDLNTWPGPILRLFMGELSPDDLLEAAADDVEWRAQEKACESHFYIGEYYLQRKDTGAAVEAFRRAITTDVRYLEEYDDAQLELKRLFAPPPL
ncbi:hypothetical protein DF3PB_4290001 [uncultured Defluviicoccus sp.]|uniref:Tetratricopeptide repeat protein n=1 Tax=metagenome TaxID=256318 RepID=A0A380TI83_9ZZZZ|nr:hypothetical protein DF3PB_4290001 [uncultured Defluviicoccus sp.]